MQENLCVFFFSLNAGYTLKTSVRYDAFNQVLCCKFVFEIFDQLLYFTSLGILLYSYSSNSIIRVLGPALNHGNLFQP